MLLYVTGRTSGRVYDVPVGRHEHHGQLVASAGGSWRRNLRHGANLEVTVDGRRLRAYGELVEDPPEVAQIFSDLLNGLGRKTGEQAGPSGQRGTELPPSRNYGWRWWTARSFD